MTFHTLKDFVALAASFREDKSQRHATIALNGLHSPGVFDEGTTAVDQVKRYIANQEKHHRKISFQDELRALFRKHEQEWDERYVWD